MFGTKKAAELTNLQWCFQTEMLYYKFLKELHFIAS